VTTQAEQVQEAQNYIPAGAARDVPAGYKLTEIGVMPQDWQPWAVGRMGEVTTGKALAINAPGQQRPYLRTTNVFDGRIEIDDVLTMPMTDKEFELFRVVTSDVLLNEGQSLPLVGRCAIYRGEYPQPCAIQNQLLRFRARPGVCAEFAAHLFRYSQQSGVFARVALQTTSIAHLGATRFERLQLPWPEHEMEQRTIARALSDVDGLLAALEGLIAKKKDVKHAAMQQLLTGKTRLPGFSGQWQTLALGDLLKICHGRSQREVEVPDGPYPILATGGQIGTASRPLHDKPSVLIGRKGTINQPQYMETPFWTVDTLFYSVIKGRNIAKFIYFRLCLVDWMQFNEASGVPSLNAKTIEKIELPCPEPTEQAAIAGVISDIDAEITALEARRNKTRLIKKGMMQQLLTGRVRLVKPSGAGAAA
jgi:type I restriction enzyme, S subunit